MVFVLFFHPALLFQCQWPWWFLLSKALYLWPSWSPHDNMKHGWPAAHPPWTESENTLNAVVSKFFLVCAYVSLFSNLWTPTVLLLGDWLTWGKWINCPQASEVWRFQRIQVSKSMGRWITFCSVASSHKGVVFVFSGGSGWRMFVTHFLRRELRVCETISQKPL